MTHADVRSPVGVRNWLLHTEVAFTGDLIVLENQVGSVFSEQGLAVTV